MALPKQEFDTDWFPEWLPQHGISANLDSEGWPRYDEVESPQDYRRQTIYSIHNESEATEVAAYRSTLSFTHDDDRDLKKKKKGAADADSPTPPPPAASEQMSLLKEILFIGTICTAQFTTQVGLTQALGILDRIGASFDVPNPGVLPWFIAGYSLTAGTFILVAGRIGDLWGYKRVFVAGMLWFALWSLVAGLSVYSNYVLFIFARVLQGFGPAVLLPNGLAILGVTYPPGLKKNMAFALFGACAPGGGVFGFVFGALFELAWWPWAFWSFALTLFGLAAFSTWSIPTPERTADQDKPLREKLVMMDIPGAITGVVALILFNFAWNQGPAYGWNQPYIGFSLIVSVMFGALFFFIETRWATAPLVPVKVFTGDILFVVGCIACGWACFGIWTFYVTQFVEVLKGATPMLLAAYICPVAIAGAFASGATGFLLSTVRPAWVMLFSLTCFMIGTILVATAPPGQTYWGQLFVAILIIPFGMDTSFPAATVIFSNAVSKEHQGMGAALVATVVNYSISLGLGFAGTIEVNVNHGGKTPADVLLGYRGALYFGIGLCALGMALSVAFVAKGYWQESRVKRESYRLEDVEGFHRHSRRHSV
ncbi:major facilitator superfamily domain-containing protein [Apiospora saccharicola]|uniref:Major facilitator superfamily domain-containing protein n=1 Tax=Apiospora saccharicola TaxID=335842 RepID=A0ABR1U7X8_9PEZI